jgi:hypothetical protein
MISMLMRNKNSPYPVHNQPQFFHPLLCFPTGYARIYQNGIRIIANIIAIAITA